MSLQANPGVSPPCQLEDVLRWSGKLVHLEDWPFNSSPSWEGTTPAKTKFNSRGLWTNHKAFAVHMVSELSSVSGTWDLGGSLVQCFSNYEARGNHWRSCYHLDSDSEGLGWELRLAFLTRPQVLPSLLVHKPHLQWQRSSVLTSRHACQGAVCRQNPRFHCCGILNQSFPSGVESMRKPFPTPLEGVWVWKAVI